MEKGTKPNPLAAFTRALFHVVGIEVDFQVVLYKLKPDKPKVPPTTESGSGSVPSAGSRPSLQAVKPRRGESQRSGNVFVGRIHSLGTTTSGKGSHNAQAVTANADPVLCNTIPWRRGKDGTKGGGKERSKTRASSLGGGQAREGVGDGEAGRKSDLRDGDEVIYGPKDLMEVAKKVACSFGGRVF